MDRALWEPFLRLKFELILGFAGFKHGFWVVLK